MEETVREGSRSQIKACSWSEVGGEVGILREERRRVTRCTLIVFLQFLCGLAVVMILFEQLHGLQQLSSLLQY
jgi:predicted nucleic acid-binding Zn ribbon protein